MVTQLDIYRGETLILSAPINEQTVYSGELMGMDKVTAVFMLPPSVHMMVNDRIEYDGRPYRIKHATQLDEATGICTAVFYGEVYDLYDVPMSHLGRTRFSYMGTPLELLGLLVDNMNAWFEGSWSLGDVSAIAEPELFTFDEVSCRQALTDIAERFGLEWRLDGKQITMVEQIGILQPLPPLQYGRGVGLQLLSREPVDTSFATVWRFYGGSKNLPAGYRDNMDRITSQDDGEYYETNVALYGRKGGSVTFEDVYPQRTAEVETAPDLNTITDSDIDFDIEDSYITDGGAKIVFKTGALGGNEFTIMGYDHSTKTIRYGTKKEEDTGYELPNATRYAEPGDKYTITGIEMPESYVLAAEAEVQSRGEAHALQHNHPPVKLPLLIDEKYIREMGLAFAFRPGDSFRVKSTYLGVDGPLRLQSISWPLVNPCMVDGEISDVLLYTQQQAMHKEVKQNRREISETQRNALYARQISDEIANAAIMHQFKNTYIGERAVMTGAFVAGNPEDGEVAGVNGTGSGLEQVRMWAGASFNDRGVAPFRVLQDGSMSSTKGKIGGFTIDATTLRSEVVNPGGSEPTNPSSGIIMADGGVLSRNCAMSFLPGTTGLDFSGSLVGETSDALGELSAFLPAVVRAGMIAVRRQELTAQAINQLINSYGNYGLLASSMKLIGALYMPVRFDGGSSDTVMNASDYLVIKGGTNDNVLLPENPEHGRIAKVRNGRSVAITVEGNGQDIVNTSNATVTSVSLDSGRTKVFHFLGGNYWLELTD